MVFFFNDTATTEIYTLSLHDALPICGDAARRRFACEPASGHAVGEHNADRKSTRLNSSHLVISYAVFCLKKKQAKIRLGQLPFRTLQPDKQIPRTWAASSAPGYGASN